MNDAHFQTFSWIRSQEIKNGSWKTPGAEVDWSEMEPDIPLI